MGPHKKHDNSVVDFKCSKKEKKKRKEIKLLKALKKANIGETSKIDGSETVSQTPQEVHEISTLSIAVPGSILENAQSPELRTYLAGQIARAAGIFKIDEMIIFIGNIVDIKKREDLDEDGKPIRHSCMQPSICWSVKSPGFTSPSSTKDEFLFREGITTNLPTKPGHGSVVNCGLLKDVIVDRNLEPGLRVTVKLTPHEGSKKKCGIIVPPSLPRAETGTYWGYTVRIAQSLGAVFSQAPYPNGYDLTIGTSERGNNIDNIPKRGLPEHHHAIVVFGGLQGLEAALENDEVLTVDDPVLLFDHYLNTCPEQGSRTIRTEEAILISLAELRKKFNPKFNNTRETMV
ncbi:hypothetical protein L9F63_018005 [Diploptera punctata]|uniref:Uncharacterized protein n=1 Tax=Diploptera punctata TaxID=6984 RepID=A0AAD7ZZL6_DIPPU|nr:hypothetical protein L9F63_018005 [Diploptera punctata]